MVIHRETNYICYKAPMNSNVYNFGDVIESWKDYAGWHGFNTVDGTRFCTFSSTLRRIPENNVICQDHRELTVEWRLRH